MFKYSLGVSLHTGKGQNYLRHYSKIPYIMDTASLRKQILTQNIYLPILYEQEGGVYSHTTEIPTSDMIIFQLTWMSMCTVCRSFLIQWS